MDGALWTAALHKPPTEMCALSWEYSTRPIAPHREIRRVRTRGWRRRRVVLSLSHLLPVYSAKLRDRQVALASTRPLAAM